METGTGRAGLVSTLQFGVCLKLSAQQVNLPYSEELLGLCVGFCGTIEAFFFGILGATIILVMALFLTVLS